ncbi:MAG: hypothetical protein MJZ81_09220 [Bacteroidales bacterium]|nr:hypothetical protein [Bacteroidales bacterium]
MTAKDIIKSALMAYGAYKLFAQDEDETGKNDHDRFYVRPSGDDEVEYFIKVKIDKKKYESLTHPSEGAGSVDIAKVPVHDEAVGMDSTATAVANARRQCDSTIEQCRARNKLACPYHGTQIIKADILARFQQLGINEIPEVVAEKDARGRVTGSYFIKIPCADNSSSRQNIERAINQFLQTPGVDPESIGDAEYDFMDNMNEVSDPDGNGVVSGEQSGYMSYFDVDDLNPAAENNGNAHVEAQVENPEETSPQEPENEETHVQEPEHPQESQTPASEPTQEPASAPSAEPELEPPAQPEAFIRRPEHPLIASIADQLMQNVDISAAFGGDRDELVDSIHRIKDSDDNELSMQDRLLKAFMKNFLTTGEYREMLAARSETAIPQDDVTNLIARLRSENSREDGRNLALNYVDFRGVLNGTRSSEEAMQARRNLIWAMNNTEMFNGQQRSTYREALRAVDSAYGLSPADESEGSAAGATEGQMSESVEQTPSAHSEPSPRNETGEVQMAEDVDKASRWWAESGDLSEGERIAHRAAIGRLADGTASQQDLQFRDAYLAQFDDWGRRDPAFSRVAAAIRGHSEAVAGETSAPQNTNPGEETVSPQSQNQETRQEQAPQSQTENMGARTVSPYDANETISGDMESAISSEISRATTRMAELFRQANGSSANDAGKAAHRMSSYLSSLKKMAGVDRIISMTPAMLMNRIRARIQESRDAETRHRNPDGTTTTTRGYNPENGHQSTRYKRAKDAGAFLASVLGQRMTVDDATGEVSFEFTGDGTRPQLHYDSPEAFAAYRDARRENSGQTANASPVNESTRFSQRTYFQLRGERQNHSQIPADVSRQRAERAAQRLDATINSGRKSEWAESVLSRIRDRARTKLGR